MPRSCVALAAWKCSADKTFDSTRARLSHRDKRIVPSEELAKPTFTDDTLLGDMFQLGVFFYRLLGNGAWPFESSLAHQMSGGSIRPGQSPA